MAKSTKSTYKPAKKGNYKPVVRMAGGGNVSELNYSERREYIEENYAPFITDAQMIFSIYDSGIEYDYKGDRKEVVSSIIESYQALGDYTEITLPQETIYEIQDWDLVRKEIDPDTDEVIGETPLEELSADNTYNFSYNGLVDLNWRVYHDEDYDRYFYVIMPHLGGDIRGNYGDAIILEGNDKEELFYRFYEGFISGGASIYIKFKDGSEIGFDSEQDSDVFSFRVNEVYEPTGMASKYLEDYEKFDSWYGDEFLEETIDIYLARKGVAPKMMAGGSLNDETPMAYIQILGYDEGKWFNLTDYSDGQDVIDAIYDFMNELNEQFGGNREEYEVTDYEGFGDDLYDEYMGSNEFEEIIEAYEKYESSDFPADVISAYKKDSGSGNDSLSDVIDEMDNNYFGKYDNLNDFGYEMVQQGVYEPSDYDVYITDTDKRIIAGEESDSLVNDMSFEDLMNIAPDTQSEYDDEKSELEDKIVEIQEEIKDLTSLLNDTEDDDEYEKISDEIESKEIDLEDAENSYVDIDSRFEDKAREEARDSIYDELYDKLENDLSSWLEEYGYTSDLQNLSFLSIDYEKIGDDLSSDYLIIEFDGEMYFFNNYAKGGRITASKRKPKYAYYIVENSTKKLVSGYSTKAEATEQRKLLIQQYPSMRFEIYPLANLEAKTDLDVYAKKDYVELSTLDKIKKVSVDAYRYGQEKVGQANAFLERNDVKGKIKRGARKVADKTKQGVNWLRNKWLEADFGDGTGRAKFFADGGILGEIYGQKDGGNKIDVYYKTSKGQHHYLNSTNSSKTIREAVEKYKKILEGDSQTSFAERKRIDGLEGKYANGGELYDMSLPMGFYVKINPNYTATIRNLKSFESYLERKDELWGKEFGEITNVDKSASKEWVAELNRLIAKKKSELETYGTGKYKVGDEITIWRNQADRDGYVVAVGNNEILVEYEMPNGTTALNVIDLTLPEYDKYNYTKNYTTISYDNARKSKKWSSKIDASTLINNPQGSSRRKSPTKRFSDGGEIEVGNIVIGKAGSRIPAKEIGEVIQLNGNEAVVDWYFGLGKSKTHKISELMFAGKGGKGFADGGEIVWVDNFELDQDKINRAKYIINYNRGNYTIIDNKTKKAITSFPTQISAVNYIKTELNKYADGGEIKEWENSMKKRNDIEFLRIEKTEALPNNKLMVYYAYNPVGKDEFKGTQISTDVIKYANGGGVEDFTEYDFQIGDKLDLGTKGIKYFKGYDGEKLIVVDSKADIKTSKGSYAYPSSVKKVLNRKYADGGMAGLSDVSAMLPNPLPMSTITPMANGGGVGYTKKDILNFIKQLKNIQEDISEYKKELDNKNLSEWEIDNIENNKLPELSVQESHIINQLQWGTKNYFSINGKPLVVNQEIYDFLQIQGIFADGGQPVQYVPVQAVPQQPVQYVPVQAVQQQPVNSPMGNLDINSAIEFVKQNPQVLAMLRNGGSVEAEINNLDNRIHNLEELVVVMNEDEKPEMYATINQLKKEKEHLQKRGNNPEEIKPKKSFFGLFAKGGQIKLPKDNSRVHFTDDQNKEFDGLFVAEGNGNPSMFLVGFGEGSSDFRFAMEVIDWHYLDEKDNDDAHARHEASETAEEEKAEHEYDVYDNKRMLENQAVEIQHHSEELNNQVKITKQVPAWVIAKMERATTDLSDITHYLDGENKMAYGGSVGGERYDIVPFGNKFVLVRLSKQTGSKKGVIIREFNGDVMKFDDINSAKNFIKNIKPKYPYGIPKANVGMLLMASELMKNQQPQQPQVVYYVPQPQPQEPQNTGIVQNIPEMASGGDVEYDNELINDFCITNLIELANELQSVKYYVTHRFKQTDFEYKSYKGKLVIVFKEPASINAIESITKFIEKAKDCHHLFEQSVNVSGSEPNSISINLLSDKFSDFEFGKGGKVYDYAPKKINLEKTKKITTNLGNYNLGLITNDFVYFVNSEEGDDNANTMMYNKKGELLSDNIHATNDLFETLETQNNFEFIHPDIEAYRQEILKGN